jgi:hypothetical protein
MITPMGVSQWRQHGKDFGYWEYFEKEKEDFLNWRINNRKEEVRRLRKGFMFLTIGYGTVLLYLIYR